MKFLSAAIISVSLFLSCNSPAQKKMDDVKAADFPVTKTDAEWEAELSPMAYVVLRKNGTERAFTSELNDNHSKGTYVCAGCGTPLYESQHKFDSGTGWPSFDRAIEENVAHSIDKQFGSPLTEEHCAVCGGHLGHVFNDGPKETTGKRHCINGVALKFIPEK